MTGCDVGENWTRFPDLRQEDVRRLLDGPDPPPSPDLAAEAQARARTLRLRRLWSSAALWLALATAAALTLWWTTRPPGIPPLR